jgi:hypothetical protein
MRTRPIVRLCAVLAAAVAGLTGCDRFKSTSDAEKVPVPAAKLWLIQKSFKKTPGDSPEKDNVFRVLEADRDLYRAGFLTLQPDSKPADAAKFIEEYHDKLEKVDVNGVPQDVVTIRTRHIKAWRNLLNVVKRQPDAAYEEAEFMDAMHALFQGSDSGGKALGGDVVEAVSRVKKTYAELFDQALKHGIEITVN